MSTHSLHMISHPLSHHPIHGQTHLKASSSLALHWSLNLSVGASARIRQVPSSKISVKNGLSNPTKAQEGRGRPRKDVMNRCQRKALSKGCCESKEAWTVVSSRENINNNKNLARVTTKSKSETQTVSNGRVSRGERNRGV